MTTSNQKYKSILILIICFLFTFCKNDNPQHQVLNDIGAEWVINDDFPYNLKSPSIEMKMPRVLKEISGLSFVKEKNQIAAINDELGNIYFLNSKTGKIENKVKFQKFGDYEAVENVNGQYYVCNSKGELRLITLSDEAEVEILKTPLGYENNVEGLGYDASQDLLFLACKDRANFSGEKKIKGKAVYSFSTKEKSLNREPLFIVSDNQLLGWFENNVGKISKKIENRISSFSPSAIALHPTSKYFYVTSARGDLLVVFDMKGNVKHIELVRGNMEQIEGVCFDDKGNLYVSSEGVSKKGRIYVFKPLK